MFPPITAYAVDFANGNLKPYVNPYGWPDFRLSTQVPGKTSASADYRGWKLSCMATGSALANSLYLVLPQPDPVVGGPPALPADVRAYMRVTFDLPHAIAADLVSDFTEAWAVAANLRIDRSIDSIGTQQVNVTSQFVKGAQQNIPIDGVRLNTPGSLQQSDQARRLDGPLDYSRYGPIWILFPPPLFILEHAFCGYAADANGHTPGNGELRIQFPLGGEKFDQRVFSNKALLPLPAGSTIGAVGVSVATLTGTGTFGARLRSFKLSLDRALIPPGGPSTVDG